jgi:hypothetical protein
VNSCHVVALLPDLHRLLAIPTAAGWLLPHVDGAWGPAFRGSVEEMLASVAAAPHVVDNAPQ